MKKWQKISVQPHIFIMHAVISDTCMQSKSMGCTEVILKDPRADSGGKESINGQKKKMARRITFFAPFLPLV